MGLECRQTITVRMSVACGSTQAENPWSNKRAEVMCDGADDWAVCLHERWWCGVSKIVLEEWRGILQERMDSIP